MLKEFHTNDGKVAFQAVEEEIEKLCELGFRKIDVRTYEDENGNAVITMSPRKEEQREEG
jgi:hypothetical protein